MVTKTPNLELTEVQEADVGNSADSFNDSFWAIDALLQLAVKSRSVTAAPIGAAEGDRYIVPVAGVLASDPWFGHGRQIAYWSAGGWLFKTPRPGWMAYIQDESSGSPANVTTAIYIATQWETSDTPDGVLTTKADILIRGASGVTRFPVGLDNAVLLSLAAAADGLKWQTLLSAKGGLLGFTGLAFGELAVGANGAALIADSTQALGFKWLQLLASKGDLLGYTGAAYGILAAGTNGYVLTLDSTQTLGFKWAAASGGGGGGGSNVTPDTHPSSATAWDDEFEFGAALDTTGGRFTGANAWTLRTPSGSTVATSVATGALTCSGTTAASYAVQAAPGSTPYTFTAKVAAPLVASQFSIALIAWNSSTGKACQFYTQAVSGSNTYVDNVTINQSTWANTFSSEPQAMSLSAYFPGFGGFVYLRVNNDGTNLNFYVSPSGVEGTFLKVLTQTLATWTGAISHVGFEFLVNAAANPQAACDWFRRTA